MLLISLCLTDIHLQAAPSTAAAADAVTAPALTATALAHPIAHVPALALVRAEAEQAAARRISTIQI